MFCPQKMRAFLLSKAKKNRLEKGGSWFDGNTYRLDANPIPTSVQLFISATYIVNHVRIFVKNCSERLARNRLIFQIVLASTSGNLA